MKRLAAVFQRRDQRSVKSQPQQADSVSSSDGSAVHTPEPDEPPRRSTRRWSTWPWVQKPKPSQTLLTPQSPPTRRPDSVHPLPSDDDESSDEDASDGPDAHPSQWGARAPSVPGVAHRRAIANLRAVTLSALRAPPSPSPHLICPSSSTALFFPRSVNRLSPRAPSSALVTMHRTHLMRRLSAASAPSWLTMSEKASIAPFARRPKPVVPKRRRPRNGDDEAVADARRVSESSHGLEMWVSRKCFEERFVLYEPDDEGVVHAKRITGTGRAVASLEFSEGLEALAGVTADPSDYDSFLPQPPPLVCEIPSSNSSTTGPATPTPVHAAPQPARKGVRFMPGPESDDEDDEDEDDHVPLARRVEHQKHIEEREKQMRMTEERRLQALQAKAEEDKVREERRRQQYALEVNRARARREGSRTKDMSEWEEPKAAKSYTRPAYDPVSLTGSRRMASDAGPSDRSSSKERDQSRRLSNASSAGKRVPPSSSSSQLAPPALPYAQSPPRSHSADDISEAKKQRRQSQASLTSVSSRRSYQPPLSSINTSQTLPRSFQPHTPSPTSSSPSYAIPPVPPLPPGMAYPPPFYMAPTPVFVPVPVPYGPMRPPLPVSHSTEGLLASARAGGSRAGSSTTRRPEPDRRSTTGDVVPRSGRATQRPSPLSTGFTASQQQPSSAPPIPTSKSTHHSGHHGGAKMQSSNSASATRRSR